MWLTLLFRNCFLFVALRLKVHAKTQWTRDPAISNIVSREGRLSSGFASSLAHCAVECHVTSYCVSIGYDDITKECYLHSLDVAILPSESINSTTNDVLYYKVTCNHDYIHIHYFDICIKRHKVRQTWQDANNMCATEGGHLMIIQSRELLDFFEAYVYYKYRHYWIGGYMGTGGDWYWTTGEIVNATSGGQLWKPGRPFGSDSCFETDYTSLTGLTWLKNNNCNFIRRYYCQIF